ncbi:hypothetical protein [Streptomyces longispororuber]|uniref:hypothetical protein n=1 Tax=Streptomyces longispororuber TaxID=68230 RepID=UPI0036FF44DB
MTLIRGEVGQGAGDQGTEVVVEVGRDRLADAADLQKAQYGQIEVEWQAVGAVGDGLPDGGRNEGLAVAREPAREVVGAVLRGEVADQHLPPAASWWRCGRARPGDGGAGQTGPGGGSGVVELSLQGGVGPLQAGAAGDDEVGVGHQPHHPLDEALQVAVGAVADVLEGVQQDHRRDAFAGRELGELPGEQVRVEAERVQVKFGFQQVGQPRAAGRRPYGLSALAQGAGQGAGHLSDGGPEGAGQQEGLGDVGHGGLHLLGQRLAEPAGQAAAAQVLLQALAGVLVLPVPAQRHVEGRQRAAERREGGPDRQHELLEVGAS